MKTEPTGRLRWLNGVLQQEWRITDLDGDEGDEALEWRDVPQLEEDGR